MDFDSPAVMFSWLLVGAVGMGFFNYGKKNADFHSLLVGVALSVIPFVGLSLLTLLNSR